MELKKGCPNIPQDFGTGVIEGVAAPESANNASCGGGLIPLLSLGIPPNVTMAVLFSAFIIHGITPGPLLITEHPDVFWGLIASMYLGNVLLLVLNLPLIGVWVQLLKVPYGILFPLILLFLCHRFLFHRGINDRYHPYALLWRGWLSDAKI